jgi:citronellol/citronellal dehydrogenase
MQPRWFAPHLAYTMAKYGMSMCVLGMAEELRRDGNAVNAQWPRTVIATAALNLIPTADPRRARRPDIDADAAHAILTRDPSTCTGRFFIDDEALAEQGVTDLDRYAVVPGNRDLLPDLFLD